MCAARVGEDIAIAVTDVEGGQGVEGIERRRQGTGGRGEGNW